MLVSRRGEQKCRRQPARRTKVIPVKTQSSKKESESASARNKSATAENTNMERGKLVGQRKTKVIPGKITTIKVGSQSASAQKPARGTKVIPVKTQSRKKESESASAQNKSANADNTRGRSVSQVAEQKSSRWKLKQGKRKVSQSHHLPNKESSVTWRSQRVSARSHPGKNTNNESGNGGRRVCIQELMVVKGIDVGRADARKAKALPVHQLGPYTLHVFLHLTKRVTP